MPFSSSYTISTAFLAACVPVTISGGKDPNDVGRK
jgi:hypothetical protein